jgi:hypothetical protein
MRAAMQCPSTIAGTAGPTGDRGSNRKSPAENFRCSTHQRTLGSFHGLPLSIEPPYLCNTHGPVDKVWNRHGAELKKTALVNLFKLLFVNEDQAVVHDAVAQDACRRYRVEAVSGRK